MKFMWILLDWVWMICGSSKLLEVVLIMVVLWVRIRWWVVMGVFLVGGFKGWIIVCGWCGFGDSELFVFDI